MAPSLLAPGLSQGKSKFLQILTHEEICDVVTKIQDSRLQGWCYSAHCVREDFFLDHSIIACKEHLSRIYRRTNADTGLTSLGLVVCGAKLKYIRNKVEPLLSFNSSSRLVARIDHHRPQRLSWKILLLIESMPSHYRFLSIVPLEDLRH